MDTRTSAAMTDAGAADWERRAVAGQRLAQWADRDDVARVLTNLLLDPGDTAVTYSTAEALLLRSDATGLRLISAALLHADEQRVHWMHTAVVRYLIEHGDIDGFIEKCRGFVAGDNGLPEGAGWLFQWAQEIKAAQRTNND